MPKKAPRPTDQIEKLAADLSGRWVKADGIEPWLRRNCSRLTSLQKDRGWSWDDIGRALTLAGIAYGSGREWSGHLLATKMSQTRAKVAARQAGRLSVPARVSSYLPDTRPVAVVVPASPVVGENDTTALIAKLRADMNKRSGR